MKFFILIYNFSISVFKKHEIIRNFSAVFTVDVFLRAIGFLLLPVYLKLMSQYDYGLYNYLLTIISIYTAILNFGLNISQNKLYFNCNNDTEKGEMFFTINVLLFLFLGVSLFVIYFFEIDYNIMKLLVKQQILYYKYRNIILLIIVVSIYSVMLSNFFIITKRIRQIQFFNLFRFIISNSIVIYILYVSKTDTAFVRLKYSIFLEIFVMIFFLFYYFKKMKVNFRIKYAKQAIKIGLPYMFAAIPGIIIIFTDKFYIEKYCNFNDLSKYYVAIAITSVIPIISASLQMVWNPYFFNEKKIIENIRKTKTLVYWIIIIFIIISISLIIFIKILLYTNLLNDDYSFILYLLPIMLLTQIIVSVTSFLQNYLIYFNRTDLILVINIILLIPCIFITKFLTFNYQIVGATLAFLIIVIINGLANFIILKRIRKSI